MDLRIWKIWPACIVSAALAFGFSAAADPKASEWSITVFAGTLTNNDFEELFKPWQIELEKPGLVGLALSREIWRPVPGISIEVEGQIVGHFGLQSNWEFNLPILVRWSNLPWDDFVVTSLAFGAGLSYADSLPGYELERSGTTERLLAYMTVEAEFRTGWQDVWLVTRLHHRSTFFEKMGPNGGSNGFVIGLRRRF